MAHWLDKAAEILKSDESRLDKLAEMAGADPKSLYRGANMRDVDFLNIDIAGWNLCGCDLTNADLSRVQNIHKAKFDRCIFNGTKLPEGVTVEQLQK